MESDNQLPSGTIHALARISAYVGLRDEEGLRDELAKALQSGVSVLQIREAILQSYLFAGYAAAINAFIVLNGLTEESEFQTEREASLEDWKARGTELCRRIYDNQFERLVRNMKGLHPELAEWMIWEGYGKVLSRPFLSPKVRELLIVAMTAALNTERQFYSHVRGALHVGVAPDELREVFRQIVPLMDASTIPAFERILDQILSTKS